MNHGNMVYFHSKYKSSIVESSILRELDLVCSGHEEVHKGFVIRRKSEEWAMFFKNDVLIVLRDEIIVFVNAEKNREKEVAQIRRCTSRDRL